MIKGLQHNACRCRDSEETRGFYEDFLGLPLTSALEINATKTGRATRALHTFFQMGDGSYLAFFEVADADFSFKPQHDFDLHIAREVDEATVTVMEAKGRAAGHEVRGPVDHQFIRSIYFRDPNGYVIELTARLAGHAAAMDPAKRQPHAILARWQRKKTAYSSTV